MADAKKIKVLLVQPNHQGEGPFYKGEGQYFGLRFEQVGEELVADVEEELAASLIKGKRVKKLSAAVFKELQAEAAAESE